MTKPSLIFLFWFLMLSVAQAATFYIAPTGSNTNDCSFTSPCLISKLAQAGAAKAGDTWRLKDGTYGAGPVINCSAGVNSGTAGNEIVITADHERQAFLDTNGDHGLSLYGCSYWRIEGLHIRQLDNASISVNGDAIGIYNASDHVTIRRNLIEKTNRGLNTGWSAIIAYISSGSVGSTNLLLEENEVWSCFANCINLKDTTNAEVRRNYCNNSSDWDIPTGNLAVCIAIYPGTNALVENNICESIDTCLDVEPHSGSDGNKFLGNIARSVKRNVIADRQDGSQSTNTTIANDILIQNGGTYNAWVFGNTQTLSASNMTVIGDGTSANSGIVALGTSSDNSFTLTNSRVTGYPKASGVWVNSGQSSWSVNYVNAYSNGTNFNPNDFHVTNSMSTTPTNLHSCYLWIPSDSSMHGAGLGGADIGATVLYQYVGGTLTPTKLWNDTTGAPLFAGAIVAGVNDTGGLSTIAVRLNINQNGCLFPSSYTVPPPGNTPPTLRPNPPTGITVAMLISVTAENDDTTRRTAMPGDYVGLYVPGASASSFIDWFYMNGTKTPTVAINDAVLLFTAPLIVGNYEFRFYQNNSVLEVDRLATAAFTVSARGLVFKFNGSSVVKMAGTGQTVKVGVP